MNSNNLINSTINKKLSYELWLEEYKKRYCRECLIGVPAPESCYVCHQKRKIGFNCARCSHFVYYSETPSKTCTGLYETGSCFCSNCQELIRKWLKERKCACEFSLTGYSAGHSIHAYSSTINGLVKTFFKGSKLWVKLVCRSCEKVIQSFGLGCYCYLKQKEHSHLYSKQRCLNCVIGDYVRPLSEWDLKEKYQEYCQEWQVKEEIQAQISIKKQYKYDGVSYWAECSFCKGEIRGKVKDKGSLSRNKVSFWTGNEADRRVICNSCLRDKKVVKELVIKGVKRQILYNYRGRGII